MTKSQLQKVIAHAESIGNHSLAYVLRKAWADVLAQPDPPEPRLEQSPINPVWDKPTTRDYTEG